MFDFAGNAERDENSSELIPYWGLSEYEDDIKIERIVPMYPFSLDENRYERLIKILSLYRLTLGQPRQEELLESILDKDLVDENELYELCINLSPFYRGR